MMSNSSGRNSNNIRFPFTASQWQELEHQALVFKYMVSGMPVPPDLLFTIRRSFGSSSLSSKFLVHQPQHMIGWNGFQMGFGGRKIDPEPGRCRRTDGKKWRCSKEAYADSKYCERHMHRGRNRSRKPVEQDNNNIQTSLSNKNTHLISSQYSFLSPPPPPSKPHFLYPHDALSSQETANFNFLQPNPHSRETTEHCRNSIYGYGTTSEISEGNSNSGIKMKHSISTAYSCDLFLSGQKNTKHDTHHYYACDPHVSLNSSSERDQDQNQPDEKVMHHFLDKWSPKDNDIWPNSTEDHRTQLSISIPNSLHDFFMTQK